MQEQESQWHWQQWGTQWHGKGIYHITLSTANHQPLLGTLLIPEREGRKIPQEATVERSELGKGVIDSLYRMQQLHEEVKPLAYALMPTHVHIILQVKKEMPISMRKLMQGFWQGCKQTAWRLGMNGGEVFPERPYIRTLWHRGQLRTMIDYVHLNPQRKAVQEVEPENFLVQGGIELGNMTCRGVGNVKLLFEQNLFPVHVHKEWVWDAEKGDDRALRDYKNRCIIEARSGAVLVSPFINEHERQVLQVALAEGARAIYILDNGLPDRRTYKPSGTYFEACREGRMLFLSPWDYDAQKKHCTREECVRKNQLAEEICNPTRKENIE